LKKNYFLRTAAVLLVCGMFGLCIFPGTMSRYIDDLGNAAGTMARAGIFEVLVKDGNEWVSIVRGPAAGNTVNIALYETLQNAYPDAGGMTPVPDPGAHERVGTATRGAIKDDSANDRFLIAPGCGGQFRISVRNFSEVTVAVDVTAGSITGGFTNEIEWWVGGAWVSTPPAITSSGSNILAPLDASGAWVSDPVIWRWRFERGGAAWANAADQADTNLGRAGNTSMTLPVTIVVDQVD